MSRHLAAGVVAGPVLAAGLALAPQPATADSVADFYGGKTVTMIVATGEGGGYSTYARMAAQFFPKHVPGHPAFVVQHMPGAGGTKAANYLYNAAPKNGTYLGALLESTAMAQLLNSTGIKYDTRKFIAIGSMVIDNPVLMALTATGVTSAEAARHKTVIVGSSGKGSQNYLNPAFANQFAGMKFKIVLGYKGSAAVELAMERGEVQAYSGTWISWKVQHMAWLNEKKIAPLFQVGVRKEADLPDVPLLSELGQSDEDRAVLAFISSPGAVGRALFAPPDVPADRIAALRTAFLATMKDPDLLALAAKRRAVIAPTPGETVQASLDKVMAAPAAVVQRAKAAMKSLAGKE
jgi:tripartite-type tricarboxylate transporter receptor subunit TctC